MEQMIKYCVAAISGLATAVLVYTIEIYFLEWDLRIAILLSTMLGLVFGLIIYWSKSDFCFILGRIITGWGIGIVVGLSYASLFLPSLVEAFFVPLFYTGPLFGVLGFAFAGIVLFRNTHVQSVSIPHGVMDPQEELTEASYFVTGS